MLGAVADFVGSPRGKWVTFLFWIVAAGALIWQLPHLADVAENDRALFLPADAESTQAVELEQERFPASGNRFWSWFTRRLGSARRPGPEQQS
ncbi:MAG: hypothetical protein F4124_05415 [Acidimicrobiia bacterium]|nr:hypothetical protein [Acidimicrobiia bacterium]MYB74258.1 hypothetical protein [Acidimicrobiia bacterium]MYG57652.1 hypothetical protein [Acidimicrobiia bacterium]MYH98849.1 hypothetical protein [Acidimicrobiia bacterium]MYJ31315.1 hypothetical protein [Acidimicrobiia bacterium]